MDRALAVVIVGAGLLLDASVVGLIAGVPVTVVGLYLLFRPGRKR